MLVIAVVLTLCATASFLSTRHGLGLWLLLMINHGLVYQYGGSGTVHLPLFAGLLVTTIILLRRQWTGIPPVNVLVLLCLCMIMAISAVFGMNPLASFTSLITYAKCFLLAIFLAGCIKDKEDLEVLTFYAIIGLAIGGVVAIYQYKTGTFAINNIYVQRAASLRGDPNDTAMLMVAGIPLAAYWLINGRKMLVKMVAALIVVLLIAGIVLTVSRGGMVALAFVMGIIFLKRFSFSLAISAALVCLLTVVLAPQNYWDRMGGMFSGKEKHGSKSIESRIDLQKQGLLLVVDNPLLGVGPGNFGQAFMSKYKPITGFGNRMADSEVSRTYAVAHNMYLEFFAENGLIGGFLFLFVFWSSFRSALAFDRRHKTVKGFGLGFSLALAMGGMLFAGLFLSQGKNSVLWFLVGIAMAAGILARRKESAPVDGVEVIEMEEYSPSSQSKLQETRA